MNDPHVERLHYEIGSGEAISYENPEPLVFSNQHGQFDARGGTLVVQPAEHFSTEADARRAIEPFLRAWEIGADLDLNVGTITFRFARCEVIDRHPSPRRGPIVVSGALVLGAWVVSAATVHVTRRQYPAPAAFATTLDVERAHRRWTEYRAGREPLPSMAYFVLTVIETAAGGRKEAARTYNIEFNVLSKIGELASTRGDSAAARKAPMSGAYQDLRAVERAWLEQAVRRTIKRLGERAAGGMLPTLGMADLPGL